MSGDRCRLLTPCIVNVSLLLYSQLCSRTHVRTYVFSHRVYPTSRHRSCISFSAGYEFHRCSYYRRSFFSFLSSVGDFVIHCRLRNHENVQPYIGTGDSEDRPIIVVTYSSSLIDQLYRQLLSRTVSSFLLSLRRWHLDRRFHAKVPLGKHDWTLSLSLRCFCRSCAISSGSVWNAKVQAIETVRFCIVVSPITMAFEFM